MESYYASLADTKASNESQESFELVKDVSSNQEQQIDQEDHVEIKIQHGMSDEEEEDEEFIQA